MSGQASGDGAAEGDEFHGIARGDETDETVVVEDWDEREIGFADAVEDGFEGFVAETGDDLGGHELADGEVRACGEAAGDILAGEETDDDVIFDDGEVGLPAIEDDVGDRADFVVGGDEAEFAEHGVAGAGAGEERTLFSGDGFVGGTGPDEEGDEDEDGIADVEEGVVCEEDGHAFPDDGSGAGGAVVGELHGEEGAEDAAAVHGEGREHVEDDHGEVPPDEGDEEVAFALEEPVDLEERVDFEDRGERPECGGDDDIDGWACDGDEEFLPWFGGHAFEPGDPADGEEGDVAGGDAEAAGHEGVAVFVEDDAGEHAEHEEDLAETVLSGGVPDDGDEDEEGDVEEDVDAEEAPEAQRPFHEEGEAGELPCGEISAAGGLCH